MNAYDRAKIAAEVEGFLSIHFRPLNPEFPRDEHAAIVLRAKAKVETMSRNRGVSPETLSETLDLAEPDERRALLEELNETRLDPRTGGGLS